MKTRFDKLVVVRGAASRMAAAAFAHAASRVAIQKAIADRIDTADILFAVNEGAASGSDLSARMEFGTRMQAIRHAAQMQIESATADRNDAAQERKGARRALDAAIDIHRTQRRAMHLRSANQAVPPAGKQRP